MGIFLEVEDSRGDRGLGRLVEFRFKAPPGTTSSSIATHTPPGQRNCASWASQPQKSVTLLPFPGGRTTKSTKDMWWHWEKIYTKFVVTFIYSYCYVCTVLYILALFGYPEVIPCFFPICKATATVKLAKTGHDPHSSQINCVVLCTVFV